jgi:hypothetical protein
MMMMMMFPFEVDTRWDNFHFETRGHALFQGITPKTSVKVEVLTAFSDDDVALVGWDAV